MESVNAKNLSERQMMLKYFVLTLLFSVFIVNYAKADFIYIQDIESSLSAGFDNTDLWQKDYFQKRPNKGFNLD